MDGTDKQELLISIMAVNKPSCFRFYLVQTDRMRVASLCKSLGFTVVSLSIGHYISEQSTLDVD